MQSEIPLNFILSKTKQLKNNRQKKRFDNEQQNKSQTFVSSVKSGKKGTELTQDEKIRMILTGGKDSPKKQPGQKKDIYDVYRK